MNVCTATHVLTLIEVRLSSVSQVSHFNFFLALLHLKEWLQPSGNNYVSSHCLFSLSTCQTLWSTLPLSIYFKLFSALRGDGFRCSRAVRRVHLLCSPEGFSLLRWPLPAAALPLSEHGQFSVDLAPIRLHRHALLTSPGQMGIRVMSTCTQTTRFTSSSGQCLLLSCQSVLSHLFYSTCFTGAPGTVSHQLGKCLTGWRNRSHTIQAHTCQSRNSLLCHLPFDELSVCCYFFPTLSLCFTLDSLQAFSHLTDHFAFSLPVLFHLSLSRRDNVCIFANEASGIDASLSLLHDRSNCWSIEVCKLPLIKLSLPLTLVCLEVSFTFSFSFFPFKLPFLCFYLSHSLSDRHHHLCQFYPLILLPFKRVGLSLSLSSLIHYTLCTMPCLSRLRSPKATSLFF